MAKQFFDQFLSEIMSELNKPTNRVHSDEINRKINIFQEFITDECRHYNMKNGSLVTNYNNTFMIQSRNSNMNSIYDKATEEEKNKMENRGSRLIHKLIPMSYNIHDYYDGIVNNDIPLLVEFFNRDKFLFDKLIEKTEINY